MAESVGFVDAVPVVECDVFADAAGGPSQLTNFMSGYRRISLAAVIRFKGSSQLRIIGGMAAQGSARGGSANSSGSSLRSRVNTPSAYSKVIRLNSKSHGTSALSNNSVIINPSSV